MSDVDFRALALGHSVETSCPHCGAAEQDLHEALEADDVHALRCGACGRQFHLLIAECPACAGESLITWSEVPPPEALRYVRCLHCDARWLPYEEDLRGMGADGSP